MPVLKLHIPGEPPAKIDLTTIQDNVRSVVSSINRSPLADGIYIESVSIPAWPASVQVTHGLGRVPRGVLVLTNPDGPANVSGVYCSARDSFAVTMRNDVALTASVNLWVF